MKRCYEPSLPDIMRYKPKIIFERIYCSLVSDEGCNHYEAIDFIRNMAFYKYCVHFNKIKKSDLPDWRDYLAIKDYGTA